MYFACTLAYSAELGVEGVDGAVFVHSIGVLATYIPSLTGHTHLSTRITIKIFSCIAQLFGAVVSVSLDRCSILFSSAKPREK